MFHILRPSEQRKAAIAAAEFEGVARDIDVSFFFGDLKPGKVRDCTSIPIVKPALSIQAEWRRSSTARSWMPVPAISW